MITSTSSIRNVAVEPPSEEILQNPLTTIPREGTFNLPWTKFQEWALRDNISRFIVSIPRNGANEPEIYALWRTMGREVVELSGYPIEMLQQMHTQQLEQGEPTPDNRSLSRSPSMLPLLDNYQFEASGGISGTVYGIVGLLDGTRVETSRVKDVQVTLPKGYVQTEDGSVAYELGVPLRTTESVDYSLLGMTSAKGVGQAVSQLSTDTNFLLQIGTSTGIVLAAATAMNMLSHHLTINVFWV